MSATRRVSTMGQTDLKKLLMRYAEALAPWARAPHVRKAFATVPRHVFVEQGVYLPDSQGDMSYHPFDQELLEYIYSNRPLPVKKCPCVSCSQPSLLAIMLELLDLTPGMHILEIGTGTGYFAALLAEIAGAPTFVTTVEIQPDVAARAQEALDKAGYRGVSVYVRDGFWGCPENGPYDRIVVSTCSSDISPEWLAQLKPDGKLLVPLKHGGKYSAPLVRVSKDGKAKVCEWAGFGSALGELYCSGPWQETEALFSPSAAQGQLLFSFPNQRSDYFFDFHFFLALNDPATCDVAGEGKEFSILQSPELQDLLVIRVEQGSVVQVGGSKELGERLIRWHQEFIELGAPRMQDYEIDFSFSSPPGGRRASLLRFSPREWLIIRQFSWAHIRLPRDLPSESLSTAVSV